MQKTGIVLFGRANTGKSTIIYITRDILYKNGGKKIFSDGNGEINIGDDGKIEKKGDFVEIIEYNGKIILLMSGGDDMRKINSNFKKIENYDYDICVCAARSKGDTIKSIKNRFAQNLIQIGTAKIKSTHPDIKADDIITEINSAHIDRVIGIINKL